MRRSRCSGGTPRGSTTRCRTLAPTVSRTCSTTVRRTRAAGGSVDESLAVAQQAVGRAVLLATLALIIGFSALCTSQFVPTIYFGALVSLTMLGGLAGNLVLLPVLIKMVVR